MDSRYFVLIGGHETAQAAMEHSDKHGESKRVVIMDGDDTKARGIAEISSVSYAKWTSDNAPNVDDPINPPHYRAHPSKVDCIAITEHMGFCLGNVIKYVWRADLKGECLEDLRKAAWYLDREIARREKQGSK